MFSDDTQLRLMIFLGVLVLMAVLEALLPRRARQLSRVSRWSTNLFLVLINTVALKLLGPVAAIVVADYAMDNNWGLLTLSPIPIPFYVEIIIGIVLLDFAIYLQHVALHRVPFLWRFHKVHHVDRDLDVTTGIRFHPLEAVMSMLYKCAVILLLGPLTIAVVLFEIILNASAMFNHANLRLPKGMDAALRKLIVTPDFHRVHHSTIETETNSNYGFFLSIWDYLCKTYIAQPKHQHEGMVIGLGAYQSEKPANLWWCLRLPFMTPATISSESAVSRAASSSTAGTDSPTKKTNPTSNN
ncbi:MAG: sterol desaturase family protein [Cellvibrionaceae bacterium]